MDLLKQSTGQAREVLVSMPPLSRAFGLTLLFIVLGGAAMLFQSPGVSNQELLFGGRLLVDHELDAIELAFSRAGLNAWSREGRQIQIPKDQRAQYLAALSDASALPFTLRNPMKDAMEASNVFDSSSQRDSREMLAKEQDLGIKIAAFPDVQWASVDYDEGEKRGLASSRQRSASVLVMPESDQPLRPSRIKSIEELVRGSFAGLSADDIVVIDTNATAEELIEQEDPLLRKQKEAEVRIEQKLRNLLAGFPAKIAVSAQIDPTMDVRREVLRIQPESVQLLTPKSLIKVLDQSSNPMGSRLETASVIGKRSVVVSEASSTAERTTSIDQVQSHQFEESKLASLQVKSVRVSVGLPTSYYEQLYLQERSKLNPSVVESRMSAMSDSDLERLRLKTRAIIQSAVTVLLPTVESDYLAEPLVEVWDYNDFSSADLNHANQDAIVLEWISDTWTVFLPILIFGGVLLFGFLRVTRKNSVNSNMDSPGHPLGDFGSLQEGRPNANSSLQKPSMQGGVDHRLRESFASDPETSASVIKDWLRNAA